MRPRLTTANLIAVSILISVAIFVVAGRWDWIRGWGFIIVMTVGGLANVLALRIRSPDLLRRRATYGPGTKGWDRACLRLFFWSYLILLLVGALDGGRFQWSAMPVWLWPVGAAMHAAGQALVTWSMLANPFFETTVRIQSDRDQRVIDTGPYRVVRHPGYVGIIIGYLLGAPLMLGSWWALLPALVATAVFVVRTGLEDDMLQAELDGYAAYAGRVRFRLLPGVW